MLVKEYRIPLPLSLEEYRIAQLYMIAKKSRDESKGAGSGVEILVNEPYDDGPGGKGQYTHKIYHVGSHLPGWFKGLLPKSALTVEEMAWNAYPYTKTRYTCPFVQKFSLEIETYYCEDGGHQENVFKLSGSDLRNRVVDLIDVVKDQLYGTDYVAEEDPRLYVSQKTNRGPIGDDWIQEYWNECKNKKMPLANGKAIMSAYKLCKVEFHYWGMQSKIEKFIHDIALRKTMLRAHRQAWAWQDEWWGLTMEDIREIERQTQEALKKTMGAGGGMDCEESEVTRGDEDYERESSVSNLDYGGTSSHHHISSSASQAERLNLNNNNSGSSSRSGREEGASVEEGNSKADAETPGLKSDKDRGDVRGRDEGEGGGSKGTRSKSSSSSALKPEKYHRKRHSQATDKSPSSNSAQSGAGRSKCGSSSKSGLNSPGTASNKSLEMLASWRMEGLMVNDEDGGGGSDDEFFDCLDGEVPSSSSMTKWNSMDLLGQEDEGGLEVKAEPPRRRSPRSWSQGRGSDSDTGGNRFTRARASSQVPGSPLAHGSSESTCSTTVLCLVIHAGSTLDAALDISSKKSDITTFRGAFESVIRQHYPSMLGHVAIKLVPCPSICSDALGILSSLSPYSFDGYGMGDSPKMVQESIPIGAIAVLATNQPEYGDAVIKTVLSANQTYHEFLKSEMGRGFNGQIIMVGDSIGSILAYDSLTRSTHSSHGNLTDDDAPPSPGHLDADHLHATPVASRRRSSSSTSDSGNSKLDFKVNELFMFGSPLGIVLAHRKLVSDDRNLQFTRPCNQVYNLFHPTDPLATRLEPLICGRFAGVAPCNVARYSKYPLGDGQPYHLLECMQFNAHIFQDTPMTSPAFNMGGRRLSDVSVQSGVSGHMEVFPLQFVNMLTQKWWGLKRVDYALYCPEALVNFPTNALPHLFHASYWESSDAVAFILRQISHQYVSGGEADGKKETRVFTPNRPREKWIKKRTSVKLKNVTANHRANDVIVKEGLPQTLKARFMYGPLDMVALTGEKVDIYVMRDPPHGEWSQLATDTTDKNGRIAMTIPPENAFGYGIYPVKMVVRGDHTSVDFYCAVVPPKTECVVFSIDGSFTASMSVTGRDPRVRAGAVDVCRHWQELGYLIIYVTGRPDMQQHKVVSWLAQHNFPHGLVSFADGLSTDFLAHKTEFLRGLVQDHQLLIHSAYGSSKDINVYTCMGIPPDRIFIVGKVSKKQHAMATILSEGYSSHLSLLMAHGGSRPAQGNARMVIPRSCFGLPGQPMAVRRRRSARRATSFPAMSQSTDTILLSPLGSSGLSPRQSKVFPPGK